ncbi:queuosine precursor transporter [Candidatus Woesearchaeota archaeon]|nr:queuosine precursor transporter [Candidatus Woesearchaeota archaeon]
MRSYKYFYLIVGVFVAVLIVSNTASTKILDLGPFIFDGGTLLFPLAYIFGDILTEVYGYRNSRKVIWTGFACLFLATMTYYLVGLLPPNAEWGGQEAYQQILGIVPRIAIASLIAYFAGEFSNSYIMAKMKIWMKGKQLWMRTIGSTLVGEGIDTVLFVLIAFFGVLPNSLLISIVISNYIFKVLIEVVLTPVTYAVVGWLKKREHEDYFDYHTNFNPFVVQA